MIAINSNRSIKIGIAFLLAAVVLLLPNVCFAGEAEVYAEREDGLVLLPGVWEELGFPLNENTPEYQIDLVARSVDQFIMLTEGLLLAFPELGTGDEILALGQLSLEGGESAQSGSVRFWEDSIDEGAYVAMVAWNPHSGGFEVIADVWREEDGSWNFNISTLEDGMICICFVSAAGPMLDMPPSAKTVDNGTDTDTMWVILLSAFVLAVAAVQKARRAA